MQIVIEKELIKEHKMAKYKLTITYEFEAEDEQEMKYEAHLRLENQDDDAQVALLREGDRSGANMLAPISNNHYKHGKISIQAYLEKHGSLEVTND